MSNPQPAEDSTVVPIREPNYLRENWKAILATSEKDELQFVKIDGGVANVTNGTVLVRTPISQPDGFYILSGTNELVPSSAGSSPRWLAYPDVSTCRPRFDRMVPSPLVHRDIVRELIDFAEAVRRHGSRYHVSPLVIHSGGFYGADNLSFAMPFPVLPPGEEITVDPTQLKMALTSLLKYDAIHIAREDHIPGKTFPLFLGLDWARCALLQPLVDRWKNSRVDYH